MTYYVFSETETPETAQELESLEEVGRFLLGHDCQNYGVSEIDGEFVPYAIRMSGKREYWTNCAAETEKEAYEKCTELADFLHMIVLTQKELIQMYAEQIKNGDDLSKNELEFFEELKKKENKLT